MENSRDVILRNQIDAQMIGILEKKESTWCKYVKMWEYAHSNIVN